MLNPQDYKLSQNVRGKQATKVLASKLSMDKLQTLSTAAGSIMKVVQMFSAVVPNVQVFGMNNQSNKLRKKKRL